jgi:Protein of unknown function (DUF2793)/Chaperone of endosialidase
MEQSTPSLHLPYLVASQADKHVTVNESLDRLDLVVQLSVLSATCVAQPTSPQQGDRYILSGNSTGPQWETYGANVLVSFLDGAWSATQPNPGWLCFVADVGAMLVWSGSAWINLARTLTSSQPNVLLGRRSGVDEALEALPIGPIVQGLMDATTPSEARAALQSVGTIGAETIAGEKTFSSAPILTNGLGLSLSAANGSKLFDVNNVTAVLNCTGGILTINSQNGGTTLLQISQSGAYTSSGADNAYTLGIASLRWSGVYVASGIISTSDAREKTQIEPLSPALLRAVRRVLAGVGTFQWREAVTRKGAANARHHIGVTAQSVQEAFESEGLDPSRYGLFCRDVIDDQTDLMGVDSTSGMPDPSAKGSAVTRLGLRQDQLLWLAMSSLVASLPSQPEL